MPKPQPSSLKDEIRAFQTQQGPKCGVALLPDDVAAGLADVWDDATLQHTAISRWLKANGHDISPEQVKRHRKRECRCVR